MRSDGLQKILALALLAGCSNAQSGPGGTASTDTGPTTGVDPTTGVAADDLCVPGYEGCPCFDDQCISGLECLSGFCVVVPAADPTTDETTAPGESTSSTTDVGSSESTADASSTSTGDDASSSGTFPACTDSDTYCAENELSTCVDGQWEVTTTCDDHCAGIGYAATLGCADAAGCECDAYLDAVCEGAVYAYCACVGALFVDGWCTVEQFEQAYVDCFTGATVLYECWSGYVISTIEQCEMLAAECGT